MGLGNKETIMEAVKTAISNIKTSGGYNLTIYYCDRQFKEPEGNTCPADFINESTESPTRLLKDLFKKVQKVKNVAFIYDESGTTATTLNKFIDDIKRAMMVDITWGGQARDTVLVSVQPNEAQTAPWGVAIITHDITYYDVR